MPNTVSDLEMYMTEAEAWRDRVQRDMGRIEGAIKSLEDHAGRTDLAIMEVKTGLKEMDGKLDILIQRNAREDGAEGAKKATFDMSVGRWTILGIIVSAIAVFADIAGRLVSASVFHGVH